MDVNRCSQGKGFYRGGWLNKVKGFTAEVAEEKRRKYKNWLHEQLLYILHPVLTIKKSDRQQPWNSLSLSVNNL